MKKAVGVKLDRVPNLPDVTKHNIHTAIKNDATLGALNVPRYFPQGRDGKKV